MFRQSTNDLNQTKSLPGFRVVSDITGRHYRQVDSDVTEGVIMTRRMKFRLVFN